jgi:NADH-quinone oxidoreductase subunit N
VTLLLGAAPKLAAFAICIRVLVEGLLPMAFNWQQMLMVLAVASLVIGNLTAIAQTNLKRMLAYSTIAQTGFVLLGLMSGVVGGDTANTAAAYSSAMYYSITYVLTTLGTFGMIMLLARAGFEAEELEDFKGLSKRSPWFAAVMSIFLFSLAGVPPMMGFAAKFAVLQSVLATGALWLTVLAVLFSLIGAFYYLRVVKIMWFDEPTDTAPLAVPFDMRAMLTANGIAIVVLGIYAGPLLAACMNAMTQTLSR